MLRTVLRHAGALRVDHILGLFRLWWIPDGHGAGEGTYVRYDHEAMVGVLLLEARVHGHGDADLSPEGLAQGVLELRAQSSLELTTGEFVGHGDDGGGGIGVRQRDRHVAWTGPLQRPAKRRMP